MTRFSLVAGAIYGFLSVALGAFGAHALKATLTDELLKTWETGVRYMAIHAVALLIVGIWVRGQTAQGDPLEPTLQWAALCFFIGTLLFSGSLYALCLSGVRALGAITPLGGLILMAGWLLLAVAAARGA
jgi:uncharacterized membrane protein YgdD (TMEM256/DUF423 family)